MKTNKIKIGHNTKICDKCHQLPDSCECEMNQFIHDHSGGIITHEERQLIRSVWFAALESKKRISTKNP